MNKLMALLGFAVLTGFLGILLWFVPRVDLGAVIVITIALCGYDFLTSAKS